MAVFDPFANFDFAQGGSPRGNGDPGDADLNWTGDTGGDTGTATPTRPPVSFPKLNPGADALEIYNQVKDAYDDYVTKYNVDPADYTKDPYLTSLTSALTESAKAIATDAEKRKTAAEGDERAYKLAEMTANRQLEASRISADKALAAAGISAGASAYSAQEATRRQQEHDTFQSGESAADRAARLDLQKLSDDEALSRLEKTQNYSLGNQKQQQGFELDKQANQQEFTANENALDREIRRVQNEIAAGNLRLNEALGVLQNFLEGQKYSLPKGAEYVPGFQPGGGAQEAARLAGISYNPANYKANPVPFDPAAVVKQTMGR